MPRVCNFIWKKDSKSFPVNFSKFLGTPFLPNIFCRRPLIFLSKDLTAQQSDIPRTASEHVIVFFSIKFAVAPFLAWSHSLAIFHELLFEKMTLKDNQFYQRSYLGYRNFMALTFLSAKIDISGISLIGFICKSW